MQWIYQWEVDTVLSSSDTSSETWLESFDFGLSKRSLIKLVSAEILCWSSFGLFVGMCPLLLELLFNFSSLDTLWPLCWVASKLMSSSSSSSFNSRPGKRKSIFYITFVLFIYKMKCHFLLIYANKKFRIENNTKGEQYDEMCAVDNIHKGWAQNQL